MDTQTPLKHRLLPPLVFALWCLAVGALVGLEAGSFLGATAIFSGVEDGFFDTSVAGTLAGRLFQPINVIGLFVLAAAAFVLSLWMRAERVGTGGKVGFFLLQGALLCLLLELTVVAPQIAALRDSLGEQFGSVGAAPADDPDRRRFAMLHGMSMLRAVIQLALTTGAFLLVATSWRGRGEDER